MDNLVVKPKVHAVIQARMGSTRLPGKILKDILGEPMLLRLVNRVKSSKLLDDIIIATTTLGEDDAVEHLCSQNNIKLFRGDELDVLKRYYFAAKQFNSEIIVRLTGDNPLVDPKIIDIAVSTFLQTQEIETIDYLSTKNYPYGINVEVFSFSAVEKAYNQSSELHEREHVTPYLYNHPEKFQIKYLINNIDLSFHRWTVDTQEDYVLIKEIYNSLYYKKEIFLLDDILKLFEEKPELLSINKSIKQKKLDE